MLKWFSKFICIHNWKYYSGSDLVWKKCANCDKIEYD